MAENKKLSVAEILAAARNKGAPAAAPAPVESAPPAAEPVAEEAAATEPVAAAAEAPPVEKPTAKPAAKPAAAAKPAPGGKLSVAEMLAAARTKKPAEAAAPVAAAAVSSTAPAAEAKPAPKPAPVAKPAAAVAKPAVEKPAAPVVAAKDTASILAAARVGVKPGPMSKEEAAKSATKEIKVTQSKITVPPMPVKPDYAKAPAPKGKADEERRGVLQLLFGSFLAVGFTFTSATVTLWTLGFARFMFPNILTEPPSKFKVGFPNDFPPGKVEEKFKALFGVWIVNAEYSGAREIFALRTVCTHLGCTPNWLEGEQKFKCPCHGSGFYKDGINFEGPAPRPLERYSIRLADDGQLEVDKSTMFQEELGQWADPASFVSV